MGAIINLPATCAPFGLEVRTSHGTVYLSDGPAVITSNDGDMPDGSALAVVMEYAADDMPLDAGTLVVAEQHFAAFRATVEAALQQQDVRDHLATVTAESTSSAAVVDGVLRARFTDLHAYGRADADDETGATPVAQIEVRIVDLPAVLEALTEVSR